MPTPLDFARDERIRRLPTSSLAIPPIPRKNAPETQGRGSMSRYERESPPARSRPGRAAGAAGLDLADASARARSPPASASLRASSSSTPISPARSGSPSSGRRRSASPPNTSSTWRSSATRSPPARPCSPASPAWAATGAWSSSCSPSLPTSGRAGRPAPRPSPPGWSAAASAGSPSGCWWRSA